MNDIPPGSLLPKSKISQVLGWASLVVVIAVIGVFAIASYNEAIAQRKFADEKRQLDEKERNIKPYLDAARANRSRIEDRMKLERPRRVTNISAKTGLPTDFIEEHFGWFTGIDDTVRKHHPGPNMPEGFPSPAYWGFHEEIKKRFNELNPERSAHAGIPNYDTPVSVFEEMTTDRAVRESISTGSTRGRETADLNRAPLEQKYDVPIESNAYDAVIVELVKKWDAPFAWLIERELARAGDDKIDLAVVRVIDFLSGAVDRRIDFMTRGIEPLRDWSKTKKQPQK